MGSGRSGRYTNNWHQVCRVAEKILWGTINIIIIIMTSLNIITMDSFVDFHVTAKK